MDSATTLRSAQNDVSGLDQASLVLGEATRVNTLARACPMSVANVLGTRDETLKYFSPELLRCQCNFVASVCAWLL